MLKALIAASVIGTGALAVAASAQAAPASAALRTMAPPAQGGAADLVNHRRNHHCTWRRGHRTCWWSRDWRDRDRRGVTIRIR
jgi:hypothetical protein